MKRVFLDLVGIAPLNGWNQIGAPHWARLEQHRFTVTNAGELAHYTGDAQRAVIPPEGWDDYARLWPQCAELVAQLRRPAEPAQVEPETPAAPVEPTPAEIPAVPPAESGAQGASSPPDVGE